MLFLHATLDLFEFSQMLLPLVKTESILTDTDKYLSCKSPTRKNAGGLAFAAF